MARLIDADKLIDSLNIRSVTYNCIINKCIDDAPTIDAVEVVRCKDCKHWLPRTQCGFDEDYDEYHDYCKLLIPDDDYYAYIRKPDDYCSYGEYKGGK